MATSALPGMLVAVPVPMKPGAHPNPVPPPDSNSDSEFAATENRSKSQCACCSSCSARHSLISAVGDDSLIESPIEPLTPSSARQSDDFISLRFFDALSFKDRIDPVSCPYYCRHHHHQDHQPQLEPRLEIDPHFNLVKAPYPLWSRDPFPPPETARSSGASLALHRPLYRHMPLLDSSPAASDIARTTTEISTSYSCSILKPATKEQQPLASNKRRSRPSIRASLTSLRRTMTSLFRRSSSQLDKDAAPAFESGSPSTTESFFSRVATNNTRPPTSSGRFSFSRSAGASRSNSPPSPGSPVESNHLGIPDEAYLNPGAFRAKKGRSATGLSGIRHRILFAPSSRHPKQPQPRRASSFDGGKRPPPAQADKHEPIAPERQPWAMPPEAGTGAKARRMSLSLPDDFNVDVAELLSEFEYHSKLLGRHGKHLGKGAASKVKIMARKNCPTELYAVKEFRGKSNRESADDYEKKIKSEFSIAKSLHHPNIVETIRLCTDHGRWNHVMEYCSEGDLFSLVQKGHLKGEAKLKDRLCLFKQLIQGVSYLHANGIAHRDIKLENLLLTKDSKLKITDFGVSEVFSGIHPGVREAGGQCGRNMGEVRLCAPGICGSEPYIAPEVLRKQSHYDPRALDVWSSAIVMIYMVFGGAIWARAEQGNPLYDKLVEGWRKWNAKHQEPDAVITDIDYPKFAAFDFGVNPPALRRILLQMLHPDPAKRIAITDVIGNRWVKNIECCGIESYDDPTLTIDATKKTFRQKTGNKIFCHNHLPPKNLGTHSLGKMPGQVGY